MAAFCQEGIQKLVPHCDKCRNNGGEYVGKNSLKNVEPDNNKILYETILDFFLQRNVAYFLNKPRIIARRVT